VQQYAIIDRGRGPELAGTRITVYDLIPYLKAGRSPNYIAAALGLSTAQVETLARYIDEHHDEVMAANAKIEERIARGNPPEVEAIRRQLRPKFLALLAKARGQQPAGEANGSGHPE
jgi:uncharacterized protein (DUF433 family)